MAKSFSSIGALLLLIFIFFLMSPGRTAAGVTAGTTQQFNDLVTQGEYLTTVAGCVECHTPFQEQYTSQSMTADQLRVLTLTGGIAADKSRLFAGGRVFDLGPAGVIFSRNLTPDNETGLGEWTDEEIKTAIRSGRRPDGRQLFPLMPYPNYSQMAEADLDAIVAYLRTLPAVSNSVPDPPTGLTEGLPAIPITEGIVAPDPADIEARGAYMVRVINGCSDCHTPLDPGTGQPIQEMFLAGGQPFEGPWGIVYGGNITPHPETGIGDWSAEDIERVLRAGVRQDGRRLALMPWEYYREMTTEDIAAVVNFLVNDLEPVNNEVPAVALVPELQEFVEIAPMAAAAAGGTSEGLAFGLLAAFVVVVGGMVVFLLRQRGVKR
jgi:mono/diheme cytochrome c family protein